MISRARTARRHKGVPVRRLLLASAVAVIPVLAGCEAGNRAPTLSFHVPTDSTTENIGALAIRNAFVLGAPLGEKLQPGQTASLFFSVLTSGGSDQLLGATAPGSATSVQLPANGLQVTASHPVLFNGPQTEAYLTGLTRQITGGSTLTLRLRFQDAGWVTLTVPVMARASHYVTYGPAPTPTPTATASAAAHKRHPHRGATPTPTPTSS